MNDLREALGEVVEDCSDAFGDWDDVLRRAEISASTPARVPSRAHRRRLTRRRVTAAAIVAATLAILFATPAFGLLRDLIGRTNVSFTGRSAPLEVKRGFFDLSLGAPPGLAPDAIASQARRVAVFHALGRPHVLYVAPTRKGGYCDEFAGSFGGCRATRTGPELALTWQGSSFAISPHDAAATKKPPYTTLVGGDVLSSKVTSLTVEYEDGRSTEIPFVFVSKPIDAGFFLYGIPRGHERPGSRVAAVTARDTDGKVIARQRITYAAPHAPRRPPRVAAPRESRARPALPSPEPPLRQGTADGVHVVAGANGVVVFDTSAAPARIRSLIRNGSYGCFRYLRYHEDAPAELTFARRALDGTAIRIFGLPRPYDGCEIQGSYGHVWPDRDHSHSAVEIAFDGRARRFFADRAAARDLALFVRSRDVQRLRRLTGDALATALKRRYAGAITRLPSLRAALEPDRLGYVSGPTTTVFVEYSTTGRRFTVTVRGGRIVRQDVKPLALVF